MKNMFLCTLCLCMMVFLSAYGQEEPQTTSMPEFAAPDTAISVLMEASSIAGNADEKIRGQMNAPEALQTMFASNTGKTHVTIDAAIEVPDVSGIAVCEVTSREVPVESIIAFADVVIGTGAWTGDPAYGPAEAFNIGGNFDGVTQETLSIVSTQTNDRGWPLQHVDAYIQRQNGILRGSQILNYTDRRELRFSYVDFALHDRQGEDAQGCLYTRAEALALAEKAANALDPNLTEAVCGILGSDEGEEAYQICFTRTVDGIPVTYTMEEANYLEEEEDGTPIHYRILYPYESLRLVVSNEGITRARYESPYVLSAPLEKNAALLPFDQILRVAQSILPIKYAWLEDSYTIEIRVDRITLGYTRLDFKDDMYRYKLVPAWDFFGTYDCYCDGQLIVSHHEDFQSLITINAMDGIVIDRKFGF